MLSGNMKTCKPFRRVFISKFLVQRPVVSLRCQETLFSMEAYVEIKIIPTLGLDGNYSLRRSEIEQRLVWGYEGQ